MFGNIRPVGATNLGPTLTINVLVPSTAVIPVGTQFNIIQTRAGTTQSGTDGSVLKITIQDPTNPLFVAVPAAGTVAGLVAIQTTGIPLLVPLAPPPGVILPPIAPIAVPLVPVLIAVGPADVLAPIGALSDPAVVVNAIAQLAPASSDLVAPLVTFQATQQFQNLLMSRLDTPLCGDVSQPVQEAKACNGVSQHGGIWIKL